MTYYTQNQDPYYSYYDPYLEQQLKEQQAAQQQQAGAGAQIGGTAGTLGGMYAANSLMSGGSAAAGAGTVAAAPTAASVAASAPAAPVAAGGSLLPAAGIAAGAYTGYKQATGAGKALKGEDLSLIEQVALAPLTGGASFLANQFNSKKDKDQMQRDGYRKALKKSGFYDDNFNYNFANGNKVNMGLDGSVKNYNVDFSKQGAGDRVGMIQGLAAILTGQGQGSKAKDDLTGELTNAIGDKDSNKNALDMFKKAGYATENDFGQAINKLRDSGAIDQQVANAYMNGAHQAYKIENRRK